MIVDNPVNSCACRAHSITALSSRAPVTPLVDLPMRLSVTGSETRRSLALILHDSDQVHTMPAPDWHPRDCAEIDVIGRPRFLTVKHERDSFTIPVTWADRDRVSVRVWQLT